ncbi:hypothetical protein VN97_g2775 [Penicillium thymicola]|uniref:Uncharacterized protein n=1 Tax=Penicillium thymicola TaxID=293382 RepID=A0AAI9XBX5_PENTH|nr:hypothetical protein VN97_g2775 [Penicillium thymicola]
MGLVAYALGLHLLTCFFVRYGVHDAMTDMCHRGRGVGFPLYKQDLIWIINYFNHLHLGHSHRAFATSLIKRPNIFSSWSVVCLIVMLATGGYRNHRHITLSLVYIAWQ